MSINNTMITIFVKNCNQISQSFYDSVINSIQFHRLTCSCGHSSCLSIHGYYKRSVKTPAGSIPIRICRVRCSECGRTHSLLLSSLVPYSQIPASCQQQICIEYEAGRDVSSICDQYVSIDENNVKAVIRRYRKRWREMLRSNRVPFLPLKDLIQSCFVYYSMQFMQIRRMYNQLFLYTT